MSEDFTGGTSRRWFISKLGESTVFLQGEWESLFYFILLFLATPHSSRGSIWLGHHPLSATPPERHHRWSCQTPSGSLPSPQGFAHHGRWGNPTPLVHYHIPTHPSRPSAGNPSPRNPPVLPEQLLLPLLRNFPQSRICRTAAELWTFCLPYETGSSLQGEILFCSSLYHQSLARCPAVNKHLVNTCRRKERRNWGLS